MKRLVLYFLIIASLSPIAVFAAERANTVLVHPGEVVYARFTQKGRKLTLVRASKEKDETAQVVISMANTAPSEGAILKVENKLAKDLVYKLELRSLTLKRRVAFSVIPVVAGKISREELPPYIEELALYAFEEER